MTCSHSNHQIHPWLCCLCFLLQSSKGTNLRSYPLLFAERHRILFRTSHLKKKKTILKKELNQVSQQRESCFIRCVTLKKYEIRFFKKPLTKFIFLLRRSPQKISWKMWTVLCKKKKISAASFIKSKIENSLKVQRQEIQINSGWHTRGYYRAVSNAT